MLKVDLLYLYMVEYLTVHEYIPYRLGFILVCTNDQWAVSHRFNKWIRLKVRSKNNVVILKRDSKRRFILNHDMTAALVKAVNDFSVPLVQKLQSTTIEVQSRPTSFIQVGNIAKNTPRSGYKFSVPMVQEESCTKLKTSLKNQSPIHSNMGHVIKTQ